VDSDDADALEQRLLILAPIGKDAALIAAMVAKGGVSSTPCRNLDELLRELDRRAGALLVAEEALAQDDGRLARAIAQQPPWSDLPVMLLTRTGADSPTAALSLKSLGNVTLLERPVRIAALLAAVRGALRARARQYQARAYLAEREEADRRKNQFLAMLAHELRNPLAPIRTSLKVLRLTADSPAARPVYDVMDRQINLMVRLIDDLLDVSRITRGKIELRRRAVELSQVIAIAIETSQPLIDEAKHELIVTLPAEAVFVDADPMRLGQVFSNLLNNAAKFTKSGGRITIEARRDGGRAVVTVSDTGIGLSSESLSRVFDMFAQAGPDKGSAQTGLGIGLTLSRSLVEMHGGSLTALSEGEGKGSTFVVGLPLLRSVEPRPPLPAAVPPPIPEPQRILVVDDNRDAADTLGDLLQALGARVQVVYDGCAALEALATFNPAVAVIDLGMPGMDGYDVARRVRAEPGFNGVTLVALTGWNQAAERAREAGFDHHMVKPVDPDTLQAVLAAVPK
jgi:signal transduction histidine kinase